MQISMFVLMGLLVFPSDLPPVAGQAAFVAAVLLLVARPLAVALTLIPFRVRFAPLVADALDELAWFSVCQGSRLSR
jgi:NhaP-type Na+/H+ and K+/H+ antiporter